MTEMEKQATVPYFVHEGQMARMESAPDERTRREIQRLLDKMESR